jgi:hypothetical protein
MSKVERALTVVASTRSVPFIPATSPAVLTGFSTGTRRDMSSRPSSESHVPAEHESFRSLGSRLCSREPPVPVAEVG